MLCSGKLINFLPGWSGAGTKSSVRGPLKVALDLNPLLFISYRLWVLKNLVIQTALQYKPQHFSLFFYFLMDLKTALYFPLLSLFNKLLSGGSKYKIAVLQYKPLYNISNGEIWGKKIQVSANNGACTVV